MLDKSNKLLIERLVNSSLLDNNEPNPIHKKFKPKDVPDEYLQFGIYFKSDQDITTHYLINAVDGKFNGNAIIKILTFDCPENYFNVDKLCNGCEIGILKYECTSVCELDLCGKHFMPKFNNSMQLYYDNDKYYGGNYKSDSIASLMECINYAIDYGLNKFNIKPY